MIRTSELIQEIEKLPPGERLKIIDTVINNIVCPDPELEKIWIDEAEKRWAAYKNGESTPIPYKEVIDKYKK